MKPNYEILPRKILKFYQQAIVWNTFANTPAVRRKFKPLARSAKCFKNFTSQNFNEVEFKIQAEPNFKILSERNFKISRSRIYALVS